MAPTVLPLPPNTATIPAVASTKPTASKHRKRTTPNARKAANPKHDVTTVGYMGAWHTRAHRMAFSAISSLLVRWTPGWRQVAGLDPRSAPRWQLASLHRMSLAFHELPRFRCLTTVGVGTGPEAFAHLGMRLSSGHHCRVPSHPSTPESRRNTAQIQRPGMTRVGMRPK